MSARGRSEDSTPGTRIRGGEWRVLSGLIALLVVMTSGLFLVARNAASSQSNSPGALINPVITLDEGCANFATYWIELSGVAVEPATIEGLTNCRVSADGVWFVPTGPNDPRLPAGVRLTDEERSRTEATRILLLDQIGELESRLSMSIEKEIGRIYNPQTQPVSGHLLDGELIARPRSRYTRVAQAFLLDPRYGALADYVGWIMGRKIRAYETLLTACRSDPSVGYLRVACLGLEDSLSVRFHPWVWDLRSAFSLDGYLAHLARTS